MQKIYTWQISPCQDSSWQPGIRLDLQDPEQRGRHVCRGERHRGDAKGKITSSKGSGLYFTLIFILCSEVKWNVCLSVLGLNSSHQVHVPEVGSTRRSKSPMRRAALEEDSSQIFPSPVFDRLTVSNKHSNGHLCTNTLKSASELLMSKTLQNLFFLDSSWSICANFVSAC